MPRRSITLFLIGITSPLIYGLLVLFVLADAFGSLYQAVCFRVYRIPRVRRRDYVVIDRTKLAYLTLFQKFNCLYCEYANGVIAYVTEITARTEWYWCPIKHASHLPEPHAHYNKFLEYGDATNFARKLKEARKQCRACEAAPSHETTR